ncbi:hypothetical protein AAF712_010588 [Marasmius tenuissimus]|uniref:Uncharacterized protein n=1 Tax=Marasmius tenuissimus TaxID=585030 RepID=A0ABR2ZNH5_9AGAR
MDKGDSQDVRNRAFWLKSFRPSMHSAPMYNQSTGEAMSRYDAFGPTARICLALNAARYAFYIQSVRRALSGISIGQIRKAIADARYTKTDQDGLSYKLYLMTRRSRDITIIDDFELSPISDHIQNQLIVALKRAKLYKKIDLYQQLKAVPSSRRLAGVVWKVLVSEQLMTSTLELSCHAMLRLPDPDSGKNKSRWHSSHHSSKDEKLEAIRENLKESSFQLKMSKPRVNFYSDAPEALEPSSRRDIHPNVLYIPESTSETAIDSFILFDENILYLFHATMAATHSINEGLQALSKRFQTPPVAKWRLIFLIPVSHTLVVPQQSVLGEMSLYSGQLPLPSTT